MAGDLRVLVVDDHAVNRLVLGELLKPFGCDVSFAEDGAQALSILAVDRFDLVCLDRQMPGLGGDEVVERVAADQLVLAWSTELDALPERFNGVLAKPVSLEAVADAVRRARNWRLRGPSHGVLPPAGPSRGTLPPQRLAA